MKNLQNPTLFREKWGLHGYTLFSRLKKAVLTSTHNLYLEYK